jgi:hypothetical protein
MSSGLSRFALEIRQEIAAIERIEANIVERDIALRRREASVGRRFALKRPQIRLECEKLGISVDKWCEDNLGCGLGTMRRRVRLAKVWKQYEVARRKAGNNGRYGLINGLRLVPEPRTAGTNVQGLHTQSDSDTTIAPRLDLSRCQFITGDALTELRKLKAKSVHCIICSPPYWWKRAYEQFGLGIGFEPTVAEYIAALVAVFREARRVLRDDGLLWIVLGDRFVKTGSWGGTDPKMRKRQDGLLAAGTPLPKVHLPDGSLQLIPSQVALALQADGWMLRNEIIWDKGNKVRPETVMDRASRTHETIFQFSKQRRYYYDDPIRERMGRAGTVWAIPPVSYPGHPASYPP